MGAVDSSQRDQVSHFNISPTHFKIPDSSSPIRPSSASICSMLGRPGVAIAMPGQAKVYGAWVSVVWFADAGERVFGDEVVAGLAEELLAFRFLASGFIALG